MSENYFAKHAALLQRATQAILERGYWSPYPEVPSPRFYGEGAAEAGKLAFEARLGWRFELGQSESGREVGTAEVSPYGMPMNVRYVQEEPTALLRAAAAAAERWRRAGPETWVGVALETLARLHLRSFEMAHAVMHTTGQAFLMAFQAGGPHALDRGLEAVAYAWEEMRRVPQHALWEKPQGKNEPLRMEKRFTIVPRGIALVIGCCTFPTWNGFPGLFASLATGNAVVVKPHPGAILPLALTVETARAVLAEAGFDPNVVTLAAHGDGEAGVEFARRLALDPAVKIIDFTGGTANGEWLEQHARQAQVYTEKAGVNQIVADSTADFNGMIRNLAFSLSLYSGQMCTAPQNIYVPRGGMATPDGRRDADQVAAALGEGLDKLLGDETRAVEILGAIQNTAVLDRVEKARGLGTVVRESRVLAHPQFPLARVRTPLLLRASSQPEAAFLQEIFGPVAFVVETADTAASLALAERGVRERGALTLGVYSTDAAVLHEAQAVAERSGVALSCNLTGGVYLNQSAGFSDYHGTGANPAANATLTDAAFVAGRFRVVQSRAHL